MKLPKTYNASSYENDIYKLWEESGAFQPIGHGKPFSIVLPPPNATGKLHVGHTAMLAIEDSIVRYMRMQGRDVVWIPGTDHAAIATNAVMEKQLAKEGTNKHLIGREAFLNRLHEFVDGSQDNIRGQIRAMGASVDWTRERYTMEPAMNRIVGETFINMFKDGLIYRGHRIVNWDGVLQTTVSDDELDHKEEKTTLYTFKYGPFNIATARPETKFGDKYVVMHPDDKRYAKYKHGDTFEAEWINGSVTATVIKDEVIDQSFGTGVMTITPWHDQTDFEIAEKYDLDRQQIIDLEGNLMPIAGEFAGMHITKARELVVDKLREKGLLVDEDTEYVHNIAISDRGKAVVEPQIMEQWFVDVNKPAVEWKGKKRSLKQVMQMVVKEGDIEVLPQRFDKTYFHWIDNLRDWCISRQIWWGHRIPAWYSLKDDGTHDIHVGFEPPKEGEWHQDPDTLDTWFSSALWTWTTLIEPDIATNPDYDIATMLKKSADFKKYHPTQLLETGYDILFFWVARMILMTTYSTGQVPFETVYLHGMVRTKSGAKMSKSTPEEAIDPLDVIPKYGTDALRLSLIVGQAPGNDMRIYEEKIASYRNFCNKFWNIARFVEGAVGDDYKDRSPKPKTEADHWILQQVHTTVTEVEKHMEAYELGQAYEKIYHLIWDDYADWYLEASKAEMNNSVLVYVLEILLTITHPFAPFVTETIWDTLKWEKTLLISSSWPVVKTGDAKAAAQFAATQTIVKEVRYLYAQLGLTDATLYHKGSALLDKNTGLILQLTRLKSIDTVSSGSGLRLTQTAEDCWLDVPEEKVRIYVDKLTSKQAETEKLISGLKGRLANTQYVANAPTELVQETKQQLSDAEELLKRISAETTQFNV